MNKKHSILIIEDDLSSIAVLNESLGDEYIIYSKDNGYDGIIAAKELKPDLIMLDIVMPNMSGFAVIETLKSDRDTHKIPVIFVTAQSNSADEETGLNLGAADYITKPLSPSIIKMRVRNHIRIIEQLNQIEQLGTIDVLTRIINRRYFNELIELEWTRAAENKSLFGFLLIDIDKLKTINKSVGYLNADIIIQLIANTIKQTLSHPSIRLARWGGGEFALILPHTNTDDAVKLGKTISKAVAANMLNLDKSIPPVDVTLSISAHSIVPALDYGISKFISQVDNVLHLIKAAGGGQVRGV